MAWKIVSRFGITRIVVTVVVLIGSMLAAGLAVAGADSPPQRAQLVSLSSGSSFDLSGTVGSLAPGLVSSLVLQVTNPNAFAITLRTVEISVVSEPAGCPSDNLTIAGQAFSGAPPTLTVTGLSAVVLAHQSATQALAILLDRSAGNGCQDVTYAFQYLGTATGVTVVVGNLPTSTTVTSTPNPSYVGHQVTLEARVVVAWVTKPDILPSGRVTFWRCRRPAHLPSHSMASACHSAVPAGQPARLISGVARLVLRHLAAGSYVYFATFAPSGAMFARSNSRTITQRILCPRKHPKCR
jgi:hypothetical protein